jgi:hypothetical protein
MGILFGNMIFMTYSHTDKQIDTALEVVEKVFQKIQSYENTGLPLEGNLPVELW